MLRVGIVGIGFMGMIHFLTYKKVKGAKVAAICETIPKRLTGDWRGIQGNFGPPGEKVDLTGIGTYSDLDGLLANPEIDLIDICLPPAAHADATLKALRAGKHVFCEKPMALTIADARKMDKEAAKSGKLLMIGHVLPLFPEYAAALKIVQSGKYGALLGGHFKRVISDPQWLPAYYDPQKIGGPMLDLHIHDAHYIRLLFGMPTQLHSTGRMRGEVAEYFQTQFIFADPKLVVSATSGVVLQQARPFLHGFEIHLERATLVFEFGVIDGKPTVMMPFTVIADKGKPKVPDLGDGDPLLAFQAELAKVVQGVRENRPAEFLSSELARDAIRICQCEHESLVSGRRMKVG